MKNYSEYNEQEFLLAHFSNRPAGFFIDIGANNGWKGSNTYALFLGGWSGICVESDPGTFGHLKETFAGSPQISCVHAAVWDHEGAVDFYSHDVTDSGLSTVFGEVGPTMKKVSVPCTRLDTIIADHHVTSVDLLCIDAEGCDFDILAAFSWQPKPGFIMVEGNKATRMALIELICSQGYSQEFESLGNLGFNRQ